MAARSALQRTLDDTSRPEEEIFADALAVAREKKLATDYMARISDDLFRDAEHRAGTAHTVKPVSVEHAVRALVQLAIAQKESSGPLDEEPRPPPVTNSDDDENETIQPCTNQPHSEDTTSYSRTRETGGDRSTATHTVLRSGPPPERVCEGVRPTNLDDLMAMLVKIRSEADDREARYLNQIRSLKEKVNAMESSLASMQLAAQKNEERLTQKVLDLSARPGNFAKAVETPPARKPSYGEITRATTARPRTVPQRPSSGERRPCHEEAEVHSHSSGCTGDGDATLECGSGTRTLHADVDNSHTHGHTRTRPATPDANTSRPSARQLKPFESDDEDDLPVWTLVTRSKPSGRKAALYVGNLDESASEEKLLEFIEKRSIQAGLKRPKVHTCSIIRREEGELGSWGAHLVIDHGSHELLYNRSFWPSRTSLDLSWQVPGCGKQRGAPKWRSPTNVMNKSLHKTHATPLRVLGPAP